MTNAYTETGYEYGEAGHEFGEQEFGETGEQEFGEFGESGHEFGEFGEQEFGEQEFGEQEFGEVGESQESEQFLGSILGMLSGESGTLSEAHEVELATELLEISNEQELEQFLGKLVRGVAKGVGNFVKSPVGRALGGVLKSVAKKALPVVGGALGSFVAPGVGTAIGSKLGSLASGLFEINAEAMPQEQAQFEVARRVVRLATSATRNAVAARPNPSINPRTIARAAVARAARTHAPGIYRSLIQSLRTGAAVPRGGATAPGRRPQPQGGRRGGVQGPRRRGSYGRPYGVVYGVPDGTPVAPAYADDSNGGGFQDAQAAQGAAPFQDQPPRQAVSAPPTASYGSDGRALTGRWFRRGHKIVLVGV